MARDHERIFVTFSGAARQFRGALATQGRRRRQRLEPVKQRPHATGAIQIFKPVRCLFAARRRAGRVCGVSRAMRSNVSSVSVTPPRARSPSDERDVNDPPIAALTWIAFENAFGVSTAETRERVLHQRHDPFSGAGPRNRPAGRSVGRGRHSGKQTPNASSARSIAWLAWSSCAKPALLKRSPRRHGRRLLFSEQRCDKSSNGSAIAVFRTAVPSPADRIHPRARAGRRHDGRHIDSGRRHRHRGQRLRESPTRTRPSTASCRAQLSNKSANWSRHAKLYPVRVAPRHQVRRPLRVPSDHETAGGFYAGRGRVAQISAVGSPKKVALRHVTTPMNGFEPLPRGDTGCGQIRPERAPSGLRRMSLTRSGPLTFSRGFDSGGCL